MVESASENFFNRDCDLIVNTVNCVGVAEGDLAIEFDKEFPHNWVDYKFSCLHGNIAKGLPLFTSIEGVWICSMPIKKHWLDKLDMGLARTCLSELRSWILQSEIKSVSFYLNKDEAGIGELISSIENLIASIEGLEVQLFKWS